MINVTGMESLFQPETVTFGVEMKDLNFIIGWLKCINVFFVYLNSSNEHKNKANKKIPFMIC